MLDFSFPPPYIIFSFPTMPTGKTDSPPPSKGLGVPVCVRELACVPPLTHSAKSWLGLSRQTPSVIAVPPCAGERSWKKRPVGLPLLPGPVAAPPPMRAGPGICCVPGLCVAAVTDASIASPWDTPAQPSIPFHTSETEGGKTITHIFNNLPLPVFFLHV